MGTDVEDEIRSEGHKELVISRGGDRRDFVSGELSKLNSILSDCRTPPIDEDPCTRLRRGSSAWLDQVEGPGTIKSLESCVQPAETGANSK